MFNKEIKSIPAAETPPEERTKEGSMKYYPKSKLNEFASEPIQIIQTTYEETKRYVLNERLRDALSKLLDKPYSEESVRKAFEGFSWEGENEVGFSCAKSYFMDDYSRMSVFIWHETSPIFEFYIKDGEVRSIWDKQAQMYIERCKDFYKITQEDGQT